MNSTFQRLGAVVALAAIPIAVVASDWPMWGHGPSRNMVSEEKNLPESWDPGKFKANSEEIDMATTKGVKWVAKLGSQAYGNPTVAGGRVFVGTNNESPRDPKYKGDRAVMMCFEEKSGKFLWQLNAPKLGTGKISDWEYLGICSSPAVDGDRVYVVSNRGEVLCLDVNGMANGNDGPFKDEAQYYAGGPGKPPVEVGPTDADIIWRFDMREELGVFPHNISSSSILIAGDKLFCATSNGVDWNHTNIPNPKAPACVMLDKNTGKLLGEEAEGVSTRTFHSNWSSQAFGKVGSQDMMFFGGGDGWCYGFSTTPEKGADGINTLKAVWKYDCDKPEFRTKDGKPRKYATPDGPSEVIATPVFYNNRVYVPIGQDPEHGEGMGRLSCIDATKSGDISKTGAIWTFDQINRSLSTPSIADGLLFVGDFSGYIYCLDAETGHQYWKYDTKSHIWGSTLLADGKVYAGTEDGDLVILAASKEMKLVNKVDMRSPIYASPVVANGTLYVATPTHLYAIGK